MNPISSNILDRMKHSVVNLELEHVDFEKMKFVQIITLWSLMVSSSLATDRTWWKHSVAYGVFLKSFMDSNGDGIGDLKGLISKLDYFVDIGVDTIWVSPFYSSPQADAGYDISDFYGINPTYGTMEDFEELMREMKKRGKYGFIFLHRYS